MNWTASTLWWVAAGVLVTAEMLVGTFYLLMLALGCTAGALAALLGAGTAWQIVAAALVGSGTTALWHFRRARAPRSAPPRANPDVNLDIGQTVQVGAWDAQGTARVSYRGSAWTAQFGSPGAPVPGPHVIIAVEGNRLIVAPAP